MNPFFQIEVKGMIALANIQGEWTMETALQYQEEVRSKLRQYKGTSDKIFPITSLKYWSIPSLEILLKVNSINREISAEVEFKHNALLTPQKHLALFEEVVSQYNFENLEVEAKAFVRMKDALAWGESLGYGLNHIPLDYFEKLYYSTNA